MAFNNLAVGCWWDRYPNYSSFVADEEMHEEEEYSERTYKSKLSDFSYATDLFQTAIYKFELLVDSALVGSLDETHELLLTCIEDSEMIPYNSERIKKVLSLINDDNLNTLSHI